ncbi:MAG: hypothetical protein H7343_18865 [Undibacterium sp.]|nr:hypothetical protein [Opitutaceae bacterium]
MKNIQVIDGARNSVFDIFAATEAEFKIIFGQGEDVAFIEDVIKKHRAEKRKLQAALARIWTRRIAKRDAMGVHDLLFYELLEKKVFYPTLRDEEAVNPDGTRLR